VVGFRFFLLFSLEIKNLVKQLPGQYYVKTLQN